MPPCLITIFQGWQINQTKSLTAVKALQFNHALKKAGLFPEYSATHIMRHSMGTITRKVTGSLDAAQAVTGHKDIKMVQHYAAMPSEANRKAVNDVERFMATLSGENPQDENNVRRLTLVPSPSS